MTDKLLTKEELAEFLNGISVRTIDRLRKRGMPSLQVGGQIRFEKEEVLKWLKENPDSPDKNN